MSNPPAPPVGGLRCITEIMEMEGVQSGIGDLCEYGRVKKYTRWMGNCAPILDRLSSRPGQDMTVAIEPLNDDVGIVAQSTINTHVHGRQTNSGSSERSH